MARGRAVGVDLGASAIKVALVDSDGGIVARARHALASTEPAAVLAQIARAATEVAGGRLTGPVGVAVPGVLDDERAVVTVAANLGWTDVPLREPLTAAVGVPVVCEKDGAAAALGEHWVGAGRGASSMLCVTLGTGIGGGVILGGRLWRGRSAYAGGLGHVVVAPGGPLCRCGARGCLEAVIAVREPGAQAPGPALIALCKTEGVDPTARARLSMALQDLAGVLAIAVTTLNPERLVVTGGVLEVAPRLLDRLAEAIHARLFPTAREGLGILAGTLEGYGGAVGAARLALDEAESA